MTFQRFHRQRTWKSVVTIRGDRQRLKGFWAGISNRAGESRRKGTLLTHISPAKWLLSKRLREFRADGPQVRMALFRLMGRKSEWHFSEAEHSHGSGTQLAHSNSPHRAFRVEVKPSQLPVSRPFGSYRMVAEPKCRVRPFLRIARYTAK